MLKWFSNKNLRFQIIFIMALVLSVPIVATIVNVYSGSNVDNAFKSMQEDRLKNLLYYFDGIIINNNILQVKDNKEMVDKASSLIKGNVTPHYRVARGTFMEVYFIKDKGEFTPVKLFEDRFIAQALLEGSEGRKLNIDAVLKQVALDKKDRVVYGSYNKLDIIRYYHPITLNGEVRAIALGETPIPPEINSIRKNSRYVLVFALIGLTLGFFLILILLRNLNNNILKIRQGLERMTEDLSYRMEDMGGDIGKIAEYINHMAEAMEKKDQLEEQLARSEKLASLGHMVSGIAHEIRNPLAIISGAVQLMERNFKNVEGLEEYVKIVKEQSDRENKVIQDLLDYARPSKHLVTALDLNYLIKSVLSFMNKYIQDRKAMLKLELEDNLPLALMDGDKIKQVFVNIIFNACDAMVEKGGGALTIKTEKDESYIKAYFIDTGIGIEEGKIKKIFNPYYTTKPKGTGLGLSISNNIIEMHSGSIEVISKEGEGSTFIVKLPYKGGGTP